MISRMHLPSMALLAVLSTGWVQAGDQQIDRFVVTKGTATPTEAVVTDDQAYRLRLGRADGNGIVFADKSVSRQHATIVCAQHRCAIEDVGTEGKGSTNGTAVNGKSLAPRQPFALRKGDVISLGPDAQVLAK